MFSRPIQQVDERVDRADALDLVKLRQHESHLSEGNDADAKRALALNQGGGSRGKCRIVLDKVAQQNIHI
jgi:hypothetical protein